MNVDFCKDYADAAALFLRAKGLETGPPDAPFLERVVRAFSSIPYENVTKILRYHRFSSWDDRLRLPYDVIGEHVEHNTGGTCFSLTYCLERLLGHFGFQASIAMADTPAGHNQHCAIVATVAGKPYLVDPGYLVSRPLPIPREGGLLVRNEPYNIRIQRAEGRIRLSTLEPGREKIRYALAEAPVDGEAFLEHWKRSFELPMINGILVTAVRDASHLYLHNNHFRKTGGDRVEKENLRKGYGARVEKTFGIRGGLVEEARELLQSTGHSRIKS